MKRALLAVPLALSLAGLSLAGCGKAAFGRQELEESLARHYIDLRWGRIPAAAQYVAPDLQPAFVEDWERRAQDVQLQEFDVVQITESEDGNSADVYVRLSWVDNATLSLKTATLKQTWVRTDQGWRAAALLELE